MEYLKAKDFSKLWNISERRIIKLCQEGRIVGAIKKGKIWEIPTNALKPSDKRSNIYKYINIEKRIMIINAFPELKNILNDILSKEGFIPEFKNIDEIKNNLNNFSQYYENLIYFTQNNTYETAFIMEFAKKLNYESSIVLVENIKNKTQLELNLAQNLNEEYGININTLLLDMNQEKDIINYSDIANAIVEMLLKFKSSTACHIITDGQKISLNNDNKTDYLLKGPFYKAINTCFKNLDFPSHIWCASTMLEDEWTTSPEEMKFRILNLELANREINFERIFIFKKSQIKDYKNNKTLKIYMQSNIKTMYVDYDEILKKDPHLLKIINYGWDGINNDTLIIDINNKGKYRGYISKNKEEINEAYKCFQELKKFSYDLKEILK